MDLNKQITSGKAGLTGGILSILFFFCFFILGFLQPNYNHIRDTISELVDGNFGWIQTLNFGVLIFSAIFIGFGLKKNIVKNKNILATITFWLCVIEMIGVLIFPADKNLVNYQFHFASLSLMGKVHYLMSFILMITISIMALSIVKDMKKDLNWKKMIPYSYFVLFFNLIFGALWYYFNEQGFLFEWKGLFQKIIVINILIWLMVTGFRLWKSEKNKINIFGLTGNMGCGKSTVGKVLEKNHKDVYLFDCDKVAKKELFDKKNKKEIKKILGEEVIEKERVAKIIFKNLSKKRKLEEFIHPLVWKKLEEEIQKRDKKTIFLVESAIFFEIGKDKDIDKVILVSCDVDKQKNRIKKRNNWSDKQINERLKYQISNEIKKEKAKVVINNNGSLAELEVKTKKLYLYMKSKKNEKLVL